MLKAIVSKLRALDVDSTDPSKSKSLQPSASTDTLPMTEVED